MVERPFYLVEVDDLLVVVDEFQAVEGDVPLVEDHLLVMERFFYLEVEGGLLVVVEDSVVVVDGFRAVEDDLPAVEVEVLVLEDD